MEDAAGRWSLVVESWILAVLDKGKPRAGLAGGCKARLVVMKGGLYQNYCPPEEGKTRSYLSQILFYGGTGFDSILTFPAACICTGSWGEARRPGAG